MMIMPAQLFSQTKKPSFLLRAANKLMPVFLMTKPLAERIISEIPLNHQSTSDFWWATREGSRRKKMAGKVFKGYNQKKAKEELLSGRYKDWITQKELMGWLDYYNADIRDILIAGTLMDRRSQWEAFGRLGTSPLYSAQVLALAKNELDEQLQVHLAQRIWDLTHLSFALSSPNLTSKEARAIIEQRIWLELSHKIFAGGMDMSLAEIFGMKTEGYRKYLRRFEQGN